MQSAHIAAIERATGDPLVKAYAELGDARDFRSFEQGFAERTETPGSMRASAQSSPIDVVPLLNNPHDRFGARPCENVRERRNPRIVFSIAFFGQPPPELLVLRLKKSRKTFYAQIERASFRTASGIKSSSRR
jgi:hypothetical protein